MTETDHILCERTEGLGIVTINRPQKKNALTYAMMDRLLHEVSRLADDESIRAVLLRGSGEAFCAGGDLKGEKADDPRLGTSPKARADRLHQRMATVRLLHEMPKPTIAAINGPAVGAGLGLALACDIRIASTEATFMTGFSRLALPGDFGCNYFLTRLVGPARARDLSFTSRMIDAQTAHDYGLVTHLAAPSDFEDRVREIATDLANGPTKAIGSMKEILCAAEDGASLSDVLRLEADSTVRSTADEDFREAITAVLGKRPPRFKGR